MCCDQVKERFAFRIAFVQNVQLMVVMYQVRRIAVNEYQRIG